MSNVKKRSITAKLRTKNGRYYAVFYCGNRDGKPQEIWRTLELKDKPGNKRKAQEKLEEMKVHYRGILDVPGYDISFVDYMHNWRDKKKGEVEESTYQMIHLYVDGKICRYFEPMGLRLSEVRPQHIHLFYEHLYKKGRADGKGGLKISTIKSLKSILNEAFKTAVIEELIMTNPAISVKLPAKDNPRKAHTVLNQESANRLLGYVINDELMYPLLLTTLRYGLRHGEVLGLKWTAVDFQKNLLRIETTIRNGKSPEKNGTKTETSKATFPLLPDVKEALLTRRNSQSKLRKHWGKAYIQTEYVFTFPNGRFLTQSWVIKKFKSILSECGLPYMKFHDLRHSTACILYSNGMGIKELQRWMRHGKIEMTADVYLHISKEKEKELADGLQNMLSPNSTSNNYAFERKRTRA